MVLILSYRLMLERWCYGLNLDVLGYRHSLCMPSVIIETDFQKFLLLNGHFVTISSHSFASYQKIFQKTEVQKIILRWLTGLNLYWFKSHAIKRKFICDFVKNRVFAYLSRNVFFAFFAFVWNLTRNGRKTTIYQ